MRRMVYLAGPIKGLDYNDCTDWREEAKFRLDQLGIAGVSPMRSKEFLSLEKNVSDNYDNVLACQKGIVTRDRFDVASCDIMLAYLLGAEKVSIGTMIEFGWADAAKKPIIAVMEKKGNPHDHAFVRELTGFRVESLEEGLYVARAILNP